MRILTRYVLLEFIKVFCVTLAGTTALVMVVVVGFEAKQQSIGLAQTLQIFPYILPEALRYSVPGTTLFATCMVYGRLSAFNEVIAIKSMGISPLVILWPVLMIGLGLSFLSVWLNNVAVSWGRAGVQRVVIESVEQIAYNMLRTRRSYTSSNISMNVRRVEGRKLVAPTVTIEEGGSSHITVTADEAEMFSDPQAGTLTMRFYNAIIDVGGGSGHITHPGTYEHVMNLDELSNRRDKSAGPSGLAMHMIAGEIDNQRREIVALEQKLAARAAFQMMTGRFAELTNSYWKKRYQRLDVARRTLHRLRTEPYRRWANGASCFFFIMVGAPMAIRRQRGEVLTSFFVCFLPILIAYYPLLISAVKQAKTGAWPPESVWLGNAMLLVWGLWLLRKVIRY